MVPLADWVYLGLWVLTLVAMFLWPKVRDE